MTLAYTDSGYGVMVVSSGLLPKEIDALSVSQVLGTSWPVCSVPNGSQGAKKALQKSLEWLNKFDSVVLMFDSDDAGRKAAKDCTTLFPSRQV